MRSSQVQRTLFRTPCYRESTDNRAVLEAALDRIVARSRLHEIQKSGKGKNPRIHCVRREDAAIREENVHRDMHAHRG